MTRCRVFNFVAALSLLLCLATVVLWVSTYWRSVAVTRTSGRWESGVWSETNRLCFDMEYWPPENYPSHDDGAPRWVITSFEKWTSFEWKWGTGGFVIHHTAPPESAVHDTTIAIPFWFLAGMTLILPLMRLKREQIGGCLACGYSLTGNVSGVCPECGTPVPQKAEILT